MNFFLFVLIFLTILFQIRCGGVQWQSDENYVIVKNTSGPNGTLVRRLWLHLKSLCVRFGHNFDLKQSAYVQWESIYCVTKIDYLLQLACCPTNRSPPCFT